ncbi:hypothetical protein SBY92_003010 [Candida maltosa Xu316]
MTRVSSKFKFKTTSDFNIIRKIGTEWSGPVSPEEFADVLTNNIRQYIENGGKIVAYYVEDTTNSTIVASTFVKHVKGFYKPANRSNAISSLPDPSLFGVNNITALLISFVFTHQEYRKQGLAEFCVSSAIEATEEEIIKQKLESSDDSVVDNFKKMSIVDGSEHLDKDLANYYLGKEYVWYLYSGVNTYYERFGFHAYPLDFYAAPNTLLTEESEKVITTMIQDSESSDPSQVKHSGKKLKLLSADNPADQEIVQFILQNKELDIVTEINKLLTHSELQGDRKSSTSLTNLTNILAMSKPGSHTALSSITESNTVGAGAGLSGGRRKSSVQNQTVPKFSLKPTYLEHQWNAFFEKEILKNKGETTKKFTNIQGAIVTNELQQRSYYALWFMLKGQFFIIDMGEMQFQGTQPPVNGRRRGSSLSGINELGGFNFQDLEILVLTALYVAKQRSPKFDKVYTSVVDTPSEIPDPIMFDFFTNYLPATVKENQSESTKVEFITDAAHQIGLLPMLKKFGNNKPDFELDFLNSMVFWG